MTDKMPDEIYVNDELLYPSPIDSYYEGWISFTDEKDGYKYISEQKHAEEIAALKAEHRALQEVHSDSLKFINFLQSQHRAEMAGLCDEIEKEVIASVKPIFRPHIAGVMAVIKQRISDE